MIRKATSLLLIAATTAFARTVLYEGRTPLTFTSAQLDASVAPYTTVVKGSESASTYDKLLGFRVPPTPLWWPRSEQAVSISITNSSVFMPGGDVANSQYGFRRTELIAQSANRTALEVGTTVFHFSIRADPKRPLNFKHEYQIVFIEPNDGTHVFGIQLGTPFTIPSAKRPGPNAYSFKVLNHALDVLFTTPLLPATWHNFAIQVDWDARTLGVFFSHNGDKLRKVTGLNQNNSTSSGVDGQGDFHWGVLKLPLANPKDNATQAGDVVHRGIQEGTTEALIYSGVFVEDVKGGISAGYGTYLPRIV